MLIRKGEYRTFLFSTVMVSLYIFIIYIIGCMLRHVFKDEVECGFYALQIIYIAVGLLTNNKVGFFA